MNSLSISEDHNFEPAADLQFHASLRSAALIAEGYVTLEIWGLLGFRKVDLSPSMVSPQRLKHRSTRAAHLREACRVEQLSDVGKGIVGSEKCFRLLPDGREIQDILKSFEAQLTCVSRRP